MGVISFEFDNLWMKHFIIIPSPRLRGCPQWTSLSRGGETTQDKTERITLSPALLFSPLSPASRWVPAWKYSTIESDFKVCILGVRIEHMNNHIVIIDCFNYVNPIHCRVCKRDRIQLRTSLSIESVLYLHPGLHVGTSSIRLDYCKISTTGIEH